MNQNGRRAFSLIELLIVVAIIGIMVSMVIAAFSNAAQDSREVMAKQQQAVLQEALNNWIAKNTSGTNSLADARTLYAGQATGLLKLNNLIDDYLDPATLKHFQDNTPSGSDVRSEAMVKTSHYVTFSTWATNTYPKVELQ